MTAEGEVTANDRCSSGPCVAQRTCPFPPLPKVGSEGAPRRPVIAVDVDEVLGHFVPQLCAFHNNTHGTELTPDDFTSYYFHEVCPYRTTASI